MKTGICLMIKDENEYLEEWLTHHRKLGFDRFFIYDNKSRVPIKETLNISNGENADVRVWVWDGEDVGTQATLYDHCCTCNRDYDWIAFIDTDEFIMLNGFDNIQSFLEEMTRRHGEFNGFGMSWRMYGSNPPFETRHSVTDYHLWHKNYHIKSIIKPSAQVQFVQPHSTILNGRYINELGHDITGPNIEHSSEYIWVKHTWSRSRAEFKEYVARGQGDKIPRGYVMDDFDKYNLNCTLDDKQGNTQLLVEGGVEQNESANH